MLNNEWDKNLKDLLGDYKPEGLQPNWDEFSNQMDQMAELNGIGDDPIFDEHLKESIDTFQAPGQEAGWQLIKASLDAADRQFDEDIRRRIAQFEPKYDPRTWPLFLQRLADSNFLRAKLIALKIVEVAAVFLLIFTVFNMGRLGKLPFDTPLYNHDANEVKSNTSHDDMAGNSSLQTSNENLSDKGKTNTSEEIAGSKESNPTDVTRVNQKHTKSKTASRNKSSLIASGVHVSNNKDKPDFQKLPDPSHQARQASVAIVDPLSSFAGISESKRDDNLIESTTKEIQLIQPQHTDGSFDEIDANLIASADDPRDGNLDFLFSLTSPVLSDTYVTGPHPAFVKQRKGTHAVFGILTLVDYNRLRMPEDRLNSAGRVIVFPQQGLPSYGYGGGFTMAIDHPRWAVESGLIYNSKTFEPARKLVVGTAFDNGIVQFDAMRLQLLTLPVQFRYKIENKGPFKFYALAGFNLNLIVKSDVDVSIKYHFPSLGVNENPIHNPNLANTIKESRRIKEHIRDGAPFSTKSFVSPTAGLGIEYSFNEHRTLFLQAAGQYQIPNLKFSNNNGKHVRSVSIQTGVRTPLGR
ncbi:MAG TPA: hypothetical protein VFG10_05075 [Saprospiraceae bacterium]|nr:hypothetical protein [Saprospiraceae bacterium]